MRMTIMLPFLIIAQLGWGAAAGARTPAAATDRPLTLIPTAFEVLDKLRVNTGTKAVLSDGTMNAVYVMKTPAEGNTYLNFHVDVASEAGSVLLHTKEMRLEGPATHRVGATGDRAASAPGKMTFYTPMDWFIDTGAAEVRGDELALTKAIVQFTIEVPRAGFDDLTLFVRSQRVGTVGEIRERIATEHASK
jgi:hypothetical protein